MVVGGGDSALEEALSVSKFAARVTLVHRRNKFRASRIMQERVFKNNKIEVLWDTEITEIYGSPQESVTAVGLRNIKTFQEQKLSCQGVFVAIGHEPNTALFKGQLELDERGYIMSKDFPKTSVEGVFIAGDAFDHRFRQAITAAGDGCKAALAAERYLQDLHSQTSIADLAVRVAPAL